MAGSLAELCAELVVSAGLSRQKNHRRYEGISLNNLALTENARGNHDAAVVAGEAALSLLEFAGDNNDIAAAHLNVARGLAHGSRWPECQRHLDAALSSTTGWVDPEVIAEAADIVAAYGDPQRASRIFEGTANRAERSPADMYIRLVKAHLELQRGRPKVARTLLPPLDAQAFVPGFRTSLMAFELQIQAFEAGRNPGMDAAFQAALELATRQQARFWWKTIRLTQALASGNDELAAYVESLEDVDAAHLSIQAELVVRRLADFDARGFALVRTAATQRPDRWRWALRGLLTGAGSLPADIKRAVDLLELVGDNDDVCRLRSIGKRRALRLPDAGRALIRRLAPRVYVEDLGRVSIRIGERTVPGTDIRKKVLSLLCFLLTRPQFTATREQVLEALWPEMDPEAGANSLNQSAYFLRRILEPGCDDDTTAGYLRSRADLIWLDNELVRSRSADCLELISAMRRDSNPELVTRLAEFYTGRFAVDFIYDDWSSSFRDTLHASFLDRIERAVTLDTRVGAFDRALSVAQLALQADPDAEQIELCLLRLYRRTGANAAAAEQYSHYASVMRDQLGLEPPPLESI